MLPDVDNLPFPELWLINKSPRNSPSVSPSLPASSPSLSESGTSPSTPYASSMSTAPAVVRSPWSASINCSRLSGKGRGRRGGIACVSATNFCRVYCARPHVHKCTFAQFVLVKHKACDLGDKHRANGHDRIEVGDIALAILAASKCCCRELGEQELVQAEDQMAKLRRVPAVLACRVCADSVMSVVSATNDDQTTQPCPAPPAHHTSVSQECLS